MKASDLNLEEVVDFSEGRLHLHGRRLVLHDMHAFAQYRKDLLDMVGWEHARRILTRFGYFWGHADAAAMKRIFQWDSLREWIMAGPRLHLLQGVVKTQVKSLEIDQADGTFQMEVIWRDSGEAEEHLDEIGKSDEPVCWMLVGYASGYTSFCLGKDIYFVETKCQAAGAGTCRAVGKDLASWGDEAKPFLPFYEADDIHGKIMLLTSELRKKTRALERQGKKLSALEQHNTLPFVEVHSASFRRVLEVAQRVARYDSPVLVTGESGVGKELLARYIQRLSSRSKRPFLAVNCGALPETLLDSELFGHKAGAFTGAVKDRGGLFEEATKGTLFLDEIGDISPTMQIKLLRVLQEQQIMRVGESKPRTVDVRVIAATNRDLAAAIRAGRYREDLYYRLAVIEIEIPPLRERLEDILPLARYFLQRLSKKLDRAKLTLDARCVDILQEYAWPGNVRELENAIERAAVLSKDGRVVPDLLPPAVLRSRAFESDLGHSPTATLAEVERNHIRFIMETTRGNRTQAARILGISPTTLWRKLKQE
jgi:two-component system, NtrC family, response regulator HydG